MLVLTATATLVGNPQTDFPRPCRAYAFSFSVTRICMIPSFYLSTKQTKVSHDRPPPSLEASCWPVMQGPFSKRVTLPYFPDRMLAFLSALSITFPAHLWERNHGCCQDPTCTHVLDLFTTDIEFMPVEKTLAASLGEVWTLRQGISRKIPLTGILRS